MKRNRFKASHAALGLVSLGIVAFSFSGGSGSTAAQSGSDGTYSTVVDNSQTARFDAPGWNRSAYSAGRYGRNYAYAPPAQARAARFKVNIPETGRYAVYARWPANPGYNASAPFGIKTTAGLRWKRVDQRESGGRWVKLGTYRLGAGDGYKVLASRYSGSSGYVIADAVRVTQVTRTSPGAGESEPDTGSDETQTRGADELLGDAAYDQASAEAYARSVGASRYILETIPYYYELAPRVGIAPDVLVAQAIVETGRGYYGGDSKPWNMAGIKKGGATGDGPSDFEQPATAYEGVRMHVNHMAAYTGQQTIGTPHDRYYDARAVQQSRGYWVTRISQLGNGTWATDPVYSSKISSTLDEMSRY